MHAVCDTECCPDRAVIELVDVLHALSDPVRLEMVRELASQTEISCGEFRLNVSKSTGSHHFKVLRESGVVSHRDLGTRRYYRLRRDDLEARFPGLLDSVLRATSACALVGSEGD